MATKKQRRMTFEKSSGNVFADIGFANPEREQLKAHLTLQIYRIIKSRGLTHVESGAILGIKQPHVWPRCVTVPAIFSRTTIGFFSSDRRAANIDFPTHPKTVDTSGRGDTIRHRELKGANVLRRSKLRGIERTTFTYGIFRKPSPPNVFIGGPDPDSPGFPLKTCGNDDFGLVIYLTQQAAGNETSAIQGGETWLTGRR